MDNISANLTWNELQFSFSPSFRGHWPAVDPCPGWDSIGMLTNLLTKPLWRIKSQLTSRKDLFDQQSDHITTHFPPLFFFLVLLLIFVEKRKFLLPSFGDLEIIWSEGSLYCKSPSPCGNSALSSISIILLSKVSLYLSLNFIFYTVILQHLEKLYLFLKK